MNCCRLAHQCRRRIVTTATSILRPVSPSWCSRIWPALATATASRDVQLMRSARVLLTLAMLHATWWQALDLAQASWLRLRFLVAPEAMADAFSDAWPSFLQKLSIPVTSQISEMGHWIKQNLHNAATTLFDSAPRTLIHNDVQADNLFFGEVDEEVIFIDWQMATYARCVIDVADWIRGQLEPEVRRTIESQLLRLYHARSSRTESMTTPSSSA